MSYALNELKNILSSRRAVDGVVVSTVSGVARIATKTGLQEARFVGSMGVGDRVRIDGGMATILPKPTRIYSV